MRLKEFIIFIIIFTVIYFLGFWIYDYISNKKALKKSEETKEKLLTKEKFKIFCNFYNVNTDISSEIIKAVYANAKANLTLSFTKLVELYNISKDEAILIILFLEYLGFINKRVILIDKDTTSLLTEYDNSLITKYALYLNNKFDYNTIIQRAGLNSDKELEYLNNKFLFPGVRIINSTIYYIGDLND